MVKKFLFLTLFIVIASASQAFCDTIYLKNGRFLKGKIIRQTRVSVTIQRKTGKQKVLRVNIKKITRTKAAAVKQAPAVPAESEQLAAPTEEAPLAAPEESAAAAAPEESEPAAAPEESPAAAAPEESEPASAPEESAVAGITQSQWNAERLEKQNSKVWTWGIDAGGDLWKMDADDFKKLKSSWEEVLVSLGPEYTHAQSITQGSMGAGAALFVERGKKLRVGLSIGYSVMPAVEFKVTASSPTFTYSNTWSNAAYAVPITVYAKWKYSDKTRFFASAVAAYIKTETKMSLLETGSSPTNYHGTFSASKFVPGVTAGGEMFLGESFSLSAGLKYMFSGKMDKLEGKVSSTPAGGWASTGKSHMITDDPGWTSGTTKKPFAYDFSGLRINLTARYYFGGR